MMSLTFGLFTQVSSSGPLGPLVSFVYQHLCNVDIMIYKQDSEESRLIYSSLYPMNPILKNF